ncbi:hypothetical protein [Metabacillus fastidiosus]|uniref:hypothetical protein n=1 Tax=Metabacillus fastidiosus TaxID=1458 RepID=UPI002E1DD153|nr:hypothetical protein [Metabacillus fastidiosus]
MENEELLKLNEHPDISKYDLDKVYLFTEFPDKSSSRCDNYDKAHSLLPPLHSHQIN